jgi:hypothetical protein
MAFSETQEYKLEILPNKVIQIRRSDIILKDGVAVASSFHRHVVSPGDDVSAEPAEVQACATALWTPEVVTAYAEANPNEASEEEEVTTGQ